MVWLHGIVQMKRVQHKIQQNSVQDKISNWYFFIRIWKKLFEQKFGEKEENKRMEWIELFQMFESKKNLEAIQFNSNKNENYIFLEQTQIQPLFNVEMTQQISIITHNLKKEMNFELLCLLLSKFIANSFKLLQFNILALFQQQKSI
ncbi:unnamed protein product [Paramecium sonneborni]|uniref:Uncharacterized protein n=1 Tax=Paramecium sonneborni TaxID=65129 RepID=A0A8S1RLJ2_9CILI|nr:unnamed protein product [Paramecium sonneborni]